MNDEVLNAALSYCDRGWSVIPVRPDKKPAIKWTEYQARKATPEEIRAWWQRWPESMIGIVTGKLSGIIVIDCDSEAAYQKIQELLARWFSDLYRKNPEGLSFIFGLSGRHEHRQFRRRHAWGRCTR